MRARFFAHFVLLFRFAYVSLDSAFNHQVDQAVADFEIWCEENDTQDLEAFLAANKYTEPVAAEVRNYIKKAKRTWASCLATR